MSYGIWLDLGEILSESGGHLVTGCIRYSHLVVFSNEQPPGVFQSDQGEIIVLLDIRYPLVEV